MKPSVVKVVAATTSTLVAAALGWTILRARSASGSTLVDQRASVELLLLERQVAPRGLGPFELRPVAADLPREPLDEATLARLFPTLAYVQWDPVQCFRYRPNLTARIATGGLAPDFVRRTNAEGYREDHATPDPRPDLFVVATGDSHTDGACENPYTWPNQLEARLAAAHPGRSVEVLNAGVAVYSFYHYLAAIERALPLRPDVIITLCYGGNDFLEVLLLHHVYQHTVQPPQAREYWDALKTGKDVVREADLTQALYQVAYFRRFPDEIERSIAASSALCAQIRRRCSERGVRWIFAYAPSAFDLPWPEWREQRDACARALGLSGAEMDVSNRMADRLLASLRQSGVEVVDLREKLPLAESGLYWKELHLSVKGNAQVAGILLPYAEAALAAPR